MENEQEGINLEAVNLENEEGIVLPGTIEEEVEETAVQTEQVKTNTDSDVDEEKEALKRGVNKERKARKEAEKKNRELEARIAALEEAANKTPNKTTLERLVESGVDETIAKSIAGAIDAKQSDSNKIEQELSAMKFRLELSEKSKDSNFSDIMDYEDDIKELVDKGLNVEQAYYALNYDKKKTINTKSEIERKVEAKMQNNQVRKEILGNINSNAGGVASDLGNKPKATATEIAAARMAGISINDYLAAKNADSIKQYNDYSKRKTK